MDRKICSNALLHNKFSKRIYPGSTRPQSNLALNVTQGHKRSYPTSYYQTGHNPPGSKCHTGTHAQLSNKLILNRALNATQGHKSSYQQALYFDLQPGYIYTSRWIERQTSRWIERYTSKWIEKQTSRWIERQTSKWIEKYTSKWIEKQTSRWIERQTSR